MKLALASLLIGSAAAFTASSSAGYNTALKSTVTETYTFTKSEEIFAEAQTVSDYWQTQCWRLLQKDFAK